jgi:hypothetical protein
MHVVDVSKSWNLILHEWKTVTHTSNPEKNWEIKNFCENFTFILSVEINTWCLH